MLTRFASCIAYYALSEAHVLPICVPMQVWLGQGHAYPHVLSGSPLHEWCTGVWALLQASDCAGGSIQGSAAGEQLPVAVPSVVTVHDDIF